MTENSRFISVHVHYFAGKFSPIKPKAFIRDFSASSIQMLVNYSSGIIVFYILSRELGKDSFGELNWTLALTLTIFNMLSCGIDNVSIRKIAKGDDVEKIVSTYVWHVVIGGLLFYLVLAGAFLLFPGFFREHPYIALLGLARMLIFFSTPLKQLAAGLSNFKILMWMSISSNLLRAISLGALAIAGTTSMRVVIFIFILSAAIELISCIFLSRKAFGPRRIRAWNAKDHISLVKESLPQLGVTVFDSAVARFDWIFLGLFASTIVLADYSFAYKVFEVSTLPLLILAPLLIPRFTRIFNHPDQLSARILVLHRLLRMEIATGAAVALLLNMAWVPLIDPITENKYGATNSSTILLLSICMPFLYVNNFLWTVNFAQGRLKKLLFISIIAFIINVGGNLLLIPFFSAEGAAMAYSAAMIAQTLIYFRNTRHINLQKAVWPMIASPAAAFLSGLIAWQFASGWWAVIFSVPVFIVLLVVFRQIRLDDLRITSWELRIEEHSANSQLPTPNS